MFGVRGGGVTEMTPFVGAGYTAPMVVNDSAPVISVDIANVNGIHYLWCWRHPCLLSGTLLLLLTLSGWDYPNLTVSHSNTTQ